MPYNETLGKIHSRTTLIGANSTLGPTHFPGSAGTPRRTPDHPDAHAGRNLIAPYGPYINPFGSAFFLIIVALAFTNRQKSLNAA